MEYYNLRKNPAYLYLKGSRVLEFSNTCVHVADIFEGIGLTFNGLNAVPFVHLEAQTATAVEKLDYLLCRSIGRRRCFESRRFSKRRTDIFFADGQRKTGRMLLIFIMEIWPVWLFDFGEPETKAEFRLPQLKWLFPRCKPVFKQGIILRCLRKTGKLCAHLCCAHIKRYLIS